jgi:hypothetical protein
MTEPIMLEGETLLVRAGCDTVPLSKPVVELQHAITVAFHDRLGIGLGMPVIDMLDMMAAMMRRTQRHTRRREGWLSRKDQPRRAHC